MAVPKKKVSRQKRDKRRNNKKVKSPLIYYDIKLKCYHLRHHFNYKNFI